MTGNSPSDLVASQWERTARGGRRLKDAAYHQKWLFGFMVKVFVDLKGCWRWKGVHGPTGYAQIQYRGKPMNAHRAIYQVHHGVKLQTEQYVLHRCDVRDCVNPDHLWIGSQHDNNTDCAAKGRHYEGSKTHCERGHPFSGDNLVIRKQANKRGVRRVCKTCERIRYRMALGWTEYEAATLPKVPSGYSREHVR